MPKLPDPDSYELITVEGDYITVDLIVWRRYRLPTYGVLERTLDDNPHLAKMHKYSPFLPVGAQLRIPIYSSVLSNSPQQKQIIRWWETVRGNKRPVFLNNAN